jgi:tetratricopeptide (TPR) repeat protein
MLFRTLRITFVVMLLCLLGSLSSAQMPGSPGFSRRIDGQVRLAGSNQPPEHALVRLDSWQGGTIGQVFTDRSGKFSFTGLPFGSYTLTVHIPGYADFRENYELQTTYTQYASVSMTPDPSSVVNKTAAPVTMPPAVVDSTIPIKARDEYAAGLSLLNRAKKGDLETATEHFQKAVAIAPKFYEAQLMLGLTYLDRGKWNDAISPLKTSIEIKSDSAASYLALGEAYRQQKQFDKAEQALKSGLAINDLSAQGHYALAFVYWELAQGGSKSEEQLRSWLESSWQNAKRAVEIDPQLAPAQLLAGNLLFKARHAKEALEHYEEYLKLDPDGEYAAPTKELVEKIRKVLAESDKKT